MTQYPLNQIVSFVGEKLNISSDSILHIGICHCCPVFLGSIENRIRYDYESHRRKMYNEFLDQIEMSIREGYLLKDEQVMKKIRDSEKAFNDLYIPEEMQVYLDLVEINLAKTRESRYNVLKRLIWSRYGPSPKFIKLQNISAKQKSILLNEMININKKKPDKFKKEN